MNYAIALTGGEAHGAWFEGHALEGAPDEIRIAIAIDGRIALLDLPDDDLELGEREVVYRRRSIGHACYRGRGARCVAYATYEPAEGLPHPASREGRALQRTMLEAAGLQPALRYLEGGDGKAG